MESVFKKDARVELKTTQETKNLLTHAAAAVGMDLSSFLLNDAVPRAKKVLLEQSTIQLSREAQLRFAELMQNPPTPTEAMKKLWKLPELPKGG